MRKIIALFALLAIARAQIPLLGFCPDLIPMTDFDMEKFTGIWYESERYFQFAEVVSRCVMSNYTKSQDGKYRVSNEVTSRLTGIKRVLEGEIRTPTKKDYGKLVVKYTSVPFITPETSYSVLDTDYKNFAVLWSCSGIGPVNTQSAWIMTRERLPAGEVLQRAYAVLDKYKISKLYFVKTNQEDCAYLDLLPTPKPPAKKPPKKPAEEENDLADEPVRSSEPLREIIPDVPEIIKTIRNEAVAAVEVGEVVGKTVPEVPVPETPVAPVEEAKTVPEVIMQIADQVINTAQDVGKTAAVVEEVPKEETAKVPEPVEPVIVQEDIPVQV